MRDVRQGTKEELLPFAKRLSDAVAQFGGLTALLRVYPKPRATVDRWMNAQAAPSIIETAEIATVLDVSVDWLASGLGEPTRGRRLPGSVPDVMHVPILDLSAGAGVGIENGEVEIIGLMPFDLKMLLILGVRPEKARAGRVRGTSMEPTIHDGSMFVMNIARRDLEDGGIFAIATTDGVLVKRVQRLTDGSVLLVSDNREMYSPEHVPVSELDRLNVIGRVVWSERTL